MSNLSTEQYNKANPFWSALYALDFGDFKPLYQEFMLAPENVKDIIAAVETAEVIWIIGEKYKLDESRVVNLALTTFYFLLGRISIKNFINSVEKNLNIDNNTARNIAHEENIKIFSKASLQIKKMQARIYPETQENKNVPRNVPRNVHRPEDRVVNLQKKPENKPASKIVNPNPEIEGNVVNLRRK
ncbi:hypothetical protein D4R87_01785 [bacterium]|nr:MAG: hypothetical protein D4R87_01785 [bacterium]